MTTAVKKVNDTLWAAQECNCCGRIFWIQYQSDGCYRYETEEGCKCQDGFSPADGTIPSISEWLIRMNEIPVREPDEVSDQVLTYTHTVTISKKEAERLQGYLDREQGCVPGEHDTFADYSVKFNTEYGRYGVEINVCNGDTPFVDAVLHKIDTLREQDGWSKMDKLEVSETLLGERQFEIQCNGKTLIFIVSIEAAQ